MKVQRDTNSADNCQNVYTMQSFTVNWNVQSLSVLFALDRENIHNLISKLKKIVSVCLRLLRFNAYNINVETGKVKIFTSCSSASQIRIQQTKKSQNLFFKFSGNRTFSAIREVVATVFRVLSLK